MIRVENTVRDSVESLKGSNMDPDWSRRKINNPGVAELHCLLCDILKYYCWPTNPQSAEENKKKRRIRTDARPAAKGLRIARQSGTSNAEPTPYDILYTKGDVLIRYNPPNGIFIIPEDIYSCFILDFVKEVAKFLAAKNQAQ